MKQCYTILNSSNQKQVDEGREYALEKLIEFRRYPLDRILDKLLIDKTTGKRIIWATDGYSEYGENYCDRFEITPGALAGINPVLIQPRSFKALETQQQRTKSKAEVFTPSWIVNKMVNHLDEEWFGRSDVFNIEKDQTWETETEKIDFQGKKWKDYVDRSVLEITCGEAPFIVSRYNATTGEIIPIEERIGILDRKLRIVTENTGNEEDWVKWAKRAYESVYGYEYQGDNLLIGRINLLMTFVDYYQSIWNKEAGKDLLTAITNIITWNFWQMDGLNGTVPLGVPQPVFEQMTLFDIEDKPEEKAPLCKVRKWRAKKTIRYKEIERKEGIDMSQKKFDVVIGNPPYQQSDGGNKASAVPVYQKFIEEAEKIVDGQMCFIIPDRWFAGGRGLDQFREKMKSDDEIKYLYDFNQASDCFPGMDISGGICFYIKDKNYHGDCTFVNHNAKFDKEVKRSLNEFPVIIRSNAAVSILNKIKQRNLPSLSHQVSSQKPFGLRTYVKPTQSGDLTLRWNKGKGPFPSDQVTSGYGWIDKYKVISSRVFFEHAGHASKDGNYRVLSVLERLDPKEICTETYIVVGAFDTQKEAENLEKYLKTKFVRFLILQVASSIMITKNSFLFVPEFDFSNGKLINWDASVKDIDKQLYELFDLSRDEILLIESSIKEME